MLNACVAMLVEFSSFFMDADPMELFTQILFSVSSESSLSCDCVALSEILRCYVPIHRFIHQTSLSTMKTLDELITCENMGSKMKQHL